MKDNTDKSDPTKADDAAPSTLAHQFEQALAAANFPNDRQRRSTIAPSDLRCGKKGWYCRLRLPKDDNGQRRRPSIFLGPHSELPSRAAAVEAALQVRARKVPSTRAPGTSPPWSAYCEEYLATVVVLMRKETRFTTASVIRRHIAPRFAALRLHEVTRAPIQAWIVSQAEQGAPLNTIRHRLGILITMLHTAVDQGLRAEVPSRLRFPKTQRVRRPHEAITFNVEEASRLLDAAPYPAKAYFAVALFTGLRCSEISGLEWLPHVDLENAELVVAQQAQHGLLTQLKTADARARLPMPPPLVEILTIHRARCPANQRFLFPNRDGRPITSGNMRVRHLHPLCARLGIARRGLHAFRRRFTDALKEAGAPLPVVQAALRHQDPRTTLLYFSPGAPPEVARAIEAAAATHAGKPDEPPDDDK